MAKQTGNRRHSKRKMGWLRGKGSKGSEGNGRRREGNTREKGEEGERGREGRSEFKGEIYS